jgi:hypothetical protein
MVPPNANCIVLRKRLRDGGQLATGFHNVSKYNNPINGALLQNRQRRLKLRHSFMYIREQTETHGS